LEKQKREVASRCVMNVGAVPEVFNTGGTTDR
jgi:hypothetical protein